MSFLQKAFRGARIITLYNHNPAVEPSRRALEVLLKASTGPYPNDNIKNPPLDYTVDVEEGGPTQDELITIMTYLEKTPLEPSTKQFIAVDWFGGIATVGPKLDGVERILENLKKERDGSLSSKKTWHWKFW